MSAEGAKRRRSGGGRRREPEAIPALRVDGLVKEYGEVTALAEVSIDVAAGESIVLVGHNGSGKSTLLGLIAGTLEPTDGSVAIHGQAPDTMAARAMRSWLPDAPVLYDDLTVDEHLRFVARLHGGSGDEPVIDELVERLGLAERRDQLPSQFSRGLRQKTAIAVALCRPFSVLLVDEPFVGLDAAGRAAMLDLLSEAHADGSTVVVATHDPAVLERFDRGLVMSNGELVHDGPTTGLPDWLGGA
jgi:ABC-2 type transport system ATP-binding protein